MLIIALHGFGMTGDGDELCQDIVRLAEEHGHVGLAPTYPTNNPHLAHIYLTHFTENKLKYHKTDIVFVGHSLGGFWARHLAKVFGANSLVLINPTQSPWESLQQYVGNNRNICNNEMFELSANDAVAYHVYRGDDGEQAIQRVKTCLIATKDSNQTIIEKFTDKRNVEVCMIEGYDDIMPAIEAYLYSEEDEPTVS